MIAVLPGHDLVDLHREVAHDIRIAVLIDRDGARGMRAEDRADPVLYAELRDDLLHFACDLDHVCMAG